MPAESWQIVFTTRQGRLHAFAKQVPDRGDRQRGGTTDQQLTCLASLLTQE
jgi:hypothetical protein